MMKKNKAVTSAASIPIRAEKSSKMMKGLLLMLIFWPSSSSPNCIPPDATPVDQRHASANYKIKVDGLH